MKKYIIIIIDEKQKIVDYDINADGGEYDPGEVYRYDLRSGTIINQAPEGALHIKMSTGKVIADENPDYVWNQVGGKDAAFIKVNSGELLTIIEG